MESLSNLVMGVATVTAVLVRRLELAAGPFPSFRITSFYTFLGIAVAGIVGLLGLLKNARDLWFPATPPTTNDKDGKEGDSTSGETRRGQPAPQEAKRRKQLWVAISGLLLVVAIASAVIAMYQERTRYELHVVIESGQIIVPAGTGEPTRQTLDSRDFKALEPERLVTDPDPEKGAGTWLVTWLTAEYAADRPDLPFTVTIPVDLLTEPIAVDGLDPDSYQLSYQVAGGEKVRLESLQDSRLATLDSGYHLIVGQFGYDEEKVWVPKVREIPVSVSRTLTPKHPGKVIIAVTDFKGDSRDLATMLRGFLARSNQQFKIIRTPDAAPAEATSGNPVIDLTVVEELDMDLAISGNATQD